jgi:hypothetical protein
MILLLGLLLCSQSHSLQVTTFSDAPLGVEEQFMDPTEDTLVVN